MLQFFLLRFGSFAFLIATQSWPLRIKTFLEPWLQHFHHTIKNNINCKKLYPWKNVCSTYYGSYHFSVVTRLIWVSRERALHSASIEPVSASISSATTTGRRLSGIRFNRSTNGLITNWIQNNVSTAMHNLELITSRNLQKSSSESMFMGCIYEAILLHNSNKSPKNTTSIDLRVNHNAINKQMKRKDNTKTYATWKSHQFFLAKTFGFSFTFSVLEQVSSYANVHFFQRRIYAEENYWYYGYPWEEPNSEVKRNDTKLKEVED